MAWNKEKDAFGLFVGHGKSMDGSWDCGCTYGSNNEAALMLKITKEAVKHLRNSGVKVLTDADKNNNRNMISCVKWANTQKVKYYMSVHCDYSLASKGVAPLYISSTGKKMATTVGKSVAKAMGMRWKGAFYRPDCYEVTATDMPAVIFETGAIKADIKYLKDYEKYGKALAKGICEFIGVKFVEKKAAKKTTTAKKKTNEEIAKEVIQGKWGNGEERKKKLTNAGYDYNAIQKLVNKLIK